jgi:hypothetical protein
MYHSFASCAASVTAFCSKADTARTVHVYDFAANERFIDFHFGTFPA